ncbi:DUF5060 domain-containing protein [Nonomuraea rubra]|uniref:DUF5060 domain-containing protein n=1 Tax=Nonomuraea rubra TaxID=46180 RepID=A0A7X0U3Q1_9ACTN|nr:DUF5060 domain-containing protein [Nonomuraea rubra]MBB6553933.1 hypothetical protein [Nonomuraea rubra]
MERWGVHEIELTGPSDGNPFADVRLSARFQFRNRIVEADGFYDGDGVYRVRFMPDAVGPWSYTTVSNVTELDGHAGSFEVSPASEGNHGPVRASGTDFEYADGTPYLPFGTTTYHWTHDLDEERERQTLRTLAASPFNKLRMCVLPTGAMSPPEVPFAGQDPDGLDFTRFNPVFFRHLETRVRDLLDLGIEADIILFHPYDFGRRGIEDLGRETDHGYLRYVIARLAAYRNVWWSAANEYDFNQAKTVEDWDDILRTIARLDPYEHLRSIHNGTRMYEVATLYDFTKPWVTHQSIQHWDVTPTDEWLRTCLKPVVLDEICYEGNIGKRWGNITGEELVDRFWEGMARGGYVGHGESLAGFQERAWIGNGGGLYGESPARIAFLRQVMEARGDGVLLRYLGRRQAASVTVDLPDDGSAYEVELIDTWNMTITPVDGAHRKQVRVALPRRPYLALRMTRVAR